MDWSARSRKFDVNQAAKKWEGFASTRTGYRAIFTEAQNAGWKNPKRPYWADVPLIDFASVTCKGVPLLYGAIIRAKSQSNKSEPWQSLADLRHKTFEPLAWVVPGYLPQGATVLAGRPKLGKSWLVLDWCLAVASGGTTLGVHCESGDVLYAALEDTERRLKARVQKLVSGEWPARMLYLHEMPRTDEGGIALVREWLEQASAPRLVAIDVLAKVRSGKGREEGNYDADYRAVAAWKGLADEFGVAVVLVHHVRKMGADDPLEMVSGTNGLTGAADAILVLNRDSQGCTLGGRGRDLDEFDRAVQFDKEACVWRVLGEVQDARRSDARSVIMSVLSGTAPLSPSEIAAASGQQHGNVRFLLSKMVEAGEVEKVGRGKYILPTPNIANNGLLDE